jgi:cell division protein FtsI/penicillin-binding protein 2
MAQVAAAFANHGEIPALRLVHETSTANRAWTPVDVDGSPRGTVSRITADSIRVLMEDAVLSGAASAAALPDVKVYGHTGLALSGPQGVFNAWFIGFAYLPNGSAIVATVLIEDESQASEAARIGGQALRLALDHMP